MSLQEKKTTTTITTKLQRWGHSSPHSIDWHKKERDSERDSFYLLCMCVSVWVCCVCVSLSLSLSFRLSLSLSLPVCFCCLVLSLRVSLSCEHVHSRRCPVQQHNSNTKDAWLQCAFQVLKPNFSTPRFTRTSLSLSLSLFSCPLFRASSFGTSFYGPHYFSTSLQDSFSSGPRF
jgi:hypothetical protein